MGAYRVDAIPDEPKDFTKKPRAVFRCEAASASLLAGTKPPQIWTIVSDPGADHKAYTGPQATKDMYSNNGLRGYGAIGNSESSQTFRSRKRTTVNQQLEPNFTYKNPEFLINSAQSLELERAKRHLLSRLDPEELVYSDEHFELARDAINSAMSVHDLSVIAQSLQQLRDYKYSAISWLSQNGYNKCQNYEQAVEMIKCCMRQDEVDKLFRTGLEQWLLKTA
jgi:hypothetical protein